MRLTVLNVAFPFAPIETDAVGGAEQVLAQLDRALVAAGHRSLVVACAGSRVAGRLVAVPRVHGAIDEQARARVQRAVRAAIARTLAATPVDLVHCHGTDYDAYLPPTPPPALVSLHLPLDWYAPAALRPRPGVHLQPVSARQARAAPHDVALLPPIENGVDLDAFAPRVGKHGFALVLGRVCAEKGFHDAIDAAKRADVPLLAAGRVFEWPAHRRYFDAEVAPRLDARRRWIGALAGARKRRLLAAARCVLVPSRAAETSSLVAMEALAAGTAVVAYRAAGALADLVEHGVTGYLVDDVASMAAAIRNADRIDPAACRAAAAARFDARRTTAAYLALYRRLVDDARADVQRRAAS
ncbi:MAG TPA: glycosyltransferase [Dokdonella sp.]